MVNRMDRMRPLSVWTVWSFAMKMENTKHQLPFQLCHSMAQLALCKRNFQQNFAGSAQPPEDQSLRVTNENVASNLDLLRRHFLADRLMDSHVISSLLDFSFGMLHAIVHVTLRSNCKR